MTNALLLHGIFTDGCLMLAKKYLAGVHCVHIYVKRLWFCHRRLLLQQVYMFEITCLSIYATLLPYAASKHLQKALGETQALRAGRSNVEPKIFAPLQTPSWGAGWPKLNQLEMVTTFSYRPSLVKIDARNFELLW